MDTITLRSSARHLATSRVVVTGVVFLLVLVPILLGLLRSADGSSGRLAFLHLVAAMPPALGILLTLTNLVRVLWRRSRPVLRVDDHVSLPRTGVRFPVGQLTMIQLYADPSRRMHLVLLPEHIRDRFPHDPTGVAPYTVVFPEGPTPMPYELVDLLSRRVPGVGVEKLGTV